MACAGHSMAICCSHIMRHSSSVAWVVPWSLEINHQQTAHQRSAAPHDPILATNVTYNRQSLLVSFHIRTAYFCLKTSILFCCTEMYNSQFVNLSTLSLWYMQNTCRHRLTLRYPDHKSCCGVYWQIIVYCGFALSRRNQSQWQPLLYDPCMPECVLAWLPVSVVLIEFDFAVHLCQM